MAVSERDVRHVADLARLGLDPARIASLVRELNGILAHMEVLAGVDPSEYQGLVEQPDASLPLRADEGPQIPLARPREAVAPAMRDGFYLVPRLATHEDGGTEEVP